MHKLDEVLSYFGEAVCGKMQVHLENLDIVKAFV